MSTRYDPTKAIDLSTPNPNGVFGLMGWFGPFPSRPCDTCGGEEFNATDWNMGYRCTSCHQVFGSQEEWAWSSGQGKYGRKS